MADDITYGHLYVIVINKFNDFKNRESLKKSIGQEWKWNYNTELKVKNFSHKFIKL